MGRGERGRPRGLREALPLELLEHAVGGERPQQPVKGRRVAARGLGEVTDRPRTFRHQVGDAELRGGLHRTRQPLPAQHPHHREQFVVVLHGPAVMVG